MPTRSGVVLPARLQPCNTDVDPKSGVQVLDLNTLSGYYAIS